ncbi:response regulator receiver protein [Colwellia psychrerythraea]|uniref:Response regulator receiver protein n=1 Tax=Colwellia psychrerythraea TaxID=28229 RepID=A0A099KDE2_COLPS|nr:response regulator receiver protein [Colwellia psychrerythraea]
MASAGDINIPYRLSSYRVSEAENKAQMNVVLENHHIDLIMLDITLPDEDGLMITRNLRSHSDIGIVLVTGRTDSIDKIIGLEMGADDYVTKPFELRELLGAVDLSGLKFIQLKTGLIAARALYHSYSIKKASNNE